MNQAPLAAIDSTVRRRLAAAERVFCFLDYDGTLAPLAPTPDAATPPPDTARLLGQLAAAPGTQVALVTGRTIADLRRFVDVPGLYYVGVHGLEMWSPDGTLKTDGDFGALRAQVARIKPRIRQVVEKRPGVIIEDKGVALACHYRLASRADAAAVRNAVAAVVEDCQVNGAELRIAQGHEVVEIRPRGPNKGTAVLALLAMQMAPMLAVYIGDDATDDDAFARLPAEAITIRVGSTTASTAARYSLNDPDEVHDFLRQLLAGRARQLQPAGHPG